MDVEAVVARKERGVQRWKVPAVVRVDALGKVDHAGLEKLKP